MSSKKPLPPPPPQNEMVDVKIIECNIASSDKTYNNKKEKFSSSAWRNNLTDVVHLEPGDKVSVYSSFVSVDGAGQTNTLDIKGKVIGKIELEDTEITDLDIITDRSDANYNITGCKQQKVNNRWYAKFVDLEASEPSLPTKKSFIVKDNELNFEISYYKTMNLSGYVSLPRRFVKNQEYRTTPWYSSPSSDTPTYGKCIAQNLNSYMATDYKYMDFNTGDTTDNYLVLRNNGDKYTIMIRRNTHFTTDDREPGDPCADPENEFYYQYKEIKNISIPSGFNSAEYLASELTRQLQEVKKLTTFTHTITKALNVDFQASQDLTTTIFSETETYKAMNCGNTTYFTETNFNNNVNRNLATGSSSYYIKNYQYVAMKRPDLYELGQRINWVQIGLGSSDQNSQFRGIRGSELYMGLDDKDDGDTHMLILDSVWTKNNLQRWKEFFEAQKKYTELWHEDNLKSADAETQFYDVNFLNINNSRYLHMNQYENLKQTNRDADEDFYAFLGNSYYEQTNENFNVNKSERNSQVIFTYYDESQKDIYYDNPDIGKNQYTYGFATKHRDVYGVYRIILHPEKIINPTTGDGLGIPPRLFTSTGNTIEFQRKIGFDYHWNAYGNNAIMLWDGRTDETMPVYQEDNINKRTLFYQTTTPYPETNDHQEIFPDRSGGVGYNPKFNTKTFIGGDKAKIGWDGTHFYFSDFHTPMNKGIRAGSNSDNALGGSANISAIEGAVVDASDVVYKMNIRDDFMEYTPVRFPYKQIQNFHFFPDPPEETPTTIKYLTDQQPNPNQDYYSIFDSMSGVFIENYGISEELWEDSLWGIMGFSYSQLHGTSNIRINRISTDNINNLNILTTNAEVPIEDTKIWNQNAFGQSAYNNQLSQPLSFREINNNESYAQIFTFYPQIIQKTQSIKIVANDFPVSMARGYYSIRSDIISSIHFTGGKDDSVSMPVVAVVDKMNPQGDFYFGTESSLQFTITGKKILSSVGVSIHDPDGSYANISNYSSVLFKIEKFRKISYNIVREIIQQQGLMDKKQDDDDDK